MKLIFINKSKYNKFIDYCCIQTVYRVYIVMYCENCGDFFEQAAIIFAEFVKKLRMSVFFGSDVLP